ncbi:MAG TPA: HypC/HybG/HupF family hydrogenase formation chaperone [Vicinamibacteria bacterium]
MSDGPPVFLARVVDVLDTAGGRAGRVSVRGARAEVALDLVPEARVGDTVLVQAGVALSLVTEAPPGVEWGVREV